MGWGGDEVCVGVCVEGVGGRGGAGRGEGGSDIHAWEPWLL